MNELQVRAVLNALAGGSLRAALAQSAMADQKHDHNYDMGYPDTLTFQHLYHMWDRNSLAQAGVNRIITTLWRDDPVLKGGGPIHEETPEESKVRQHFDDNRIWSKLSEAHMRSLVGDFSLAILRVADGQPWSSPVQGGRDIKDLWDIIPAWEGQVTVAEWETDQSSPRYGLPRYYNFNEVSLENGRVGGATRSLTLHPDRVLVFSSTGDTFGRSVLRAGFNSLIDHAKVLGAGAEGFWKAARSSLFLEVDGSAKLKDLAAMLGVGVSDLPNKIDEVVSDWLAGYDKSLMLQGIKADTVGVTLPSNPEQYYQGPLMAFAASIDCPTRVLIGNQSGERASTEDQKSWNSTCSSRRSREVMPVIRDLTRRLEGWGLLSGSWEIDWSDLTEPTGADKLAGAKTMAEINASSLGLGDTPFSAREIREQAGFTADEDPMGETQ